MKAVEFAPAARAEFDTAADRYEAERPGRGIRLVAAVERTVKLIVRFPPSAHRFPAFAPTSVCVAALFAASRLRSPTACWSWRSESMRSRTCIGAPTTGASASASLRLALALEARVKCDEAIRIRPRASAVGERVHGSPSRLRASWNSAGHTAHVPPHVRELARPGRGRHVQSRPADGSPGFEDGREILRPPHVQS